MKNVSSYLEIDDKNSVEARVKEHSHLVKRIAYHLLSRLPNTVQVSDLIQSGLIGLIEASQRYDANKNASFATFANIRIRGAMLDDLRKGCWMPRSVHQNMRKISQAIETIEQRKNSSASSQDIAEELGVSLDEYSNMASQAVLNSLVSLDELSEESAHFSDEHSNPSDRVEESDIAEHVEQLIKTLPEKEQLILSLYYNDKLNFKEIGKVLGVTEARISQLHTQAVGRLKARVKSGIK